MTTKAELRELVRRRLEDVSLTAPLWEDAVLDDALADGLARYGAHVPLEEQSVVLVPAGEMGLAVSGLEAGEAIARVIDPAGRVVPHLNDVGCSGQRWRWWAGEIRLAVPALGGFWTVEWRGRRLLPATDGDSVPVREGDAAAVSLIAAGSALRRRAVEEAKRGGRGVDDLLALAASWETTGERQARARGRQLRSFVAGMV